MKSAGCTRSAVATPSAAPPSAARPEASAQTNSASRASTSWLICPRPIEFSSGSHVRKIAARVSAATAPSRAALAIQAKAATSSAALSASHAPTAWRQPSALNGTNGSTANGGYENWWMCTRLSWACRVPRRRASATSAALRFTPSLLTMSGS